MAEAYERFMVKGTWGSAMKNVTGIEIYGEF
jgi:hypothetical protein